MTREEFLKVFPGLIMNYQPAPDVLSHIGNVELLMIIGPSGAGKTTIINQLGLPYIPSDVTRAPRVGEKSGMDYYFRSDYDQIIEEIKARRFVQTAVSPSGDFYATKSSSYPVYGTGVMAIVADVIPIFRRLGFSKTISAFIVPPSYDEWLRRMKNHPVNDDLSSMRLAEARRSLEFALNDQELHLILNDDLSKAVQQVKELMEGQSDRQREGLAKESVKALLSSIDSV